MKWCLTTNSCVIYFLFRWGHLWLFFKWSSFDLMKSFECNFQIGYTSCDLNFSLFLHLVLVIFLYGAFYLIKDFFYVEYLRSQRLSRFLSCFKIWYQIMNCDSSNRNSNSLFLFTNSTWIWYRWIIIKKPERLLKTSYIYSLYIREEKNCIKE